jgi:hypothetical protein
VGTDLAEELELTATESSPRAQPTRPVAEESEQLPYTVEPEAAWLHGIVPEVALEEPIVELHVA